MKNPLNPQSQEKAPGSQLSDFAAYCARIAKRLRRGQEEYGDRSFSASPLALIEEVQQELQDVCGWSYVLHQRLERIKRLLSAREVEDWTNIDAGD